MKQMLGYLTASIIGTASHYTVLYVLVQFAGIEAAFASFLGSVIGAIVIYFMNYYFVFNTGDAHFATFPKFLIVAGMSIFINYLLMKAFTSLLPINYLIIQVFVTCCVFLMSYLLNKVWTFSPCHSRCEDEA